MYDSLVIKSAADLGQLVAPIMSSPFSIPEPNIVNIDLIPQDVRACMLPAWNSKSFPAKPVSVVHLKNVFVAGEGLVFASDGSLISESITQHSETEIDLALHQVRYAKQNSIKALTGLHVLCAKRGMTNYGHWLIEMLPKLLIMHSYFDYLDCKFIVPQSSNKLGSVVEQSLRYFGLDGKHLFGLGHYPIACEDLVVMSGLTEHGTYMSPIVPRLFRELLPTESARKRKLYVRRSSKKTRRLNGAAELEWELLSKGFQVVDPETLSFPEQVSLFQNASSIVGVMGAGLANMLFSPAGTRVSVFAPECMPDTFFWFLAGLAGHTYTEIRCNSVNGPYGEGNWNNDIQVPRSSWKEIE